MVADMFLAKTQVWSLISTWSIIREARVSAWDGVLHIKVNGFDYCVLPEQGRHIDLRLWCDCGSGLLALESD